MYDIMKRSELIDIIIQKILSIQLDRPLLVSIDGIDAAGKTMFSKELALKMREMGRDIIESSIDGFHNPSIIRYRRGRYDSEGYYRDSFNIPALKVLLLDPLKFGNLRYKTKAFDYIKDIGILSPFLKAKSDSILLFNGIFINRPELRDYWDFSIYLDIGEDESIKRGLSRPEADPEKTKLLYLNRYLPGQRIYHKESEPTKYVDIIIDNNDLENPIIIR